MPDEKGSGRPSSPAGTTTNAVHPDSNHVAVGDLLTVGWAIFPCHTIKAGRCTCGNAECENPGKHPRTRNGVKDATHDPQMLKAWQSAWQDVNWSLACGEASGRVIVIDIDTRKEGFSSLAAWESEHGKLPDTLKANTGGGGRHLFFTVPEGRKMPPNRVGWREGLDARSNNGYVILAPGRHVSGGSYSWVNWGHPIAAAPDALLESLGASSGSSGSGTLPDNEDILKGVPEGKRDDTLFRACCRWRRQLGDSRSAVTVLALAAAAACSPPFPVDQAMKCVVSAFRQDHSVERVPLNDTELSRWLASELGAGMCWVPEFKAWFIYDPSRGVWVERSEEAATLLVKDRLDAQCAAEIATAETERAKKLVTVLKSSRTFTAMVNLLKGELEVSAKLFDQSPDLLCVGNGVVNLETGELRPFQASFFMTKCTPIPYEPGYRHEDWDKVLTCMAPEVAFWFQEQIGQAATGYPNPLDVMFFMKGGGENGKSSLLDGVAGALGDHRTLVPDEVIMASPGAHPTELMTLRGARMTYIEELPVIRDRPVNVNRLKKLVGTTELTARPLFGKNVTWKATHTLFVTANNLPEVRETDHGTWRRLLVVPFPYLYTKPGLPLEGSHARRSDPNLKPRVKAGAEGQHKAALTWVVEGAMRWFKDRYRLPPRAVMEATDQWRQDDDVIQAFLEDCMEFEPNSRVLGSDLHDRFMSYLFSTNRSSKAWGESMFFSALKGHDLITKHQVTKDRPLNPAVVRPDGSTSQQRGKLTAWTGLSFKKDQNALEWEGLLARGASG